MNFQALMLVLYEIAILTLDRVCLKDNHGMIGVVIQQDFIANTVQVHWGNDKKPIRKWHAIRDVIPVTFKKETTNGQRTGIQ